jgi:hypothetical protein
MLTILFSVYILIELYLTHRSIEMMVQRQDCSQPRQDLFFDAVHQMPIDSKSIERSLYPEQFVEPEVSSIEGTVVEELLAVMQEVSASSAPLVNGETDMVPVLSADDDFVTAADLYAASYHPMELSGHVSIFATVVGKERGFLHIADDERRMWVEVGEQQARYFHLYDKVVVTGEFVDGHFDLESIQLLNVVSSDYEIPDEMTG